MTNYRPMSMLTCFSKILGKVMHNRSDTHLSENNLLFERKFGSRARYSTKHILVEFFGKLLNSFDQNLYPLGIFID